jgi:hypothetical protein
MAQNVLTILCFARQLHSKYGEERYLNYFCCRTPLKEHLLLKSCNNVLSCYTLLVAKLAIVNQCQVDIFYLFGHCSLFFVPAHCQILNGRVI